MRRAFYAVVKRYPSSDWLLIFSVQFHVDLSLSAPLLFLCFSDVSEREEMGISCSMRTVSLQCV